MNTPAKLLVVALIACATYAAPGAAQWNAQSLYTEDGVEIGVDPRLFVLFSMLNGLGFDADDRTGPAPLFRPQYASARAKVRQNLGRPGSSMKDLDAVLTKNPKPSRDYIAAALELGPPPNFESKGTSPLAQAIAGPMRDWFSDEGGAQLMKIVAEEAKPTQKRLLPALDKSIKATTKLIKLGDTQDQLLDDSGAQGRVVVVVNDLDRHGPLQRVQRGEVTYIVTGPVDATDDDRLISAVTATYARTLVWREAQKVGAGTIADVRTKLDDAGKAALADDKSAAAELLACAFMRHARAAPTAVCAESPLAGQAPADEALTAMAPRVTAFAGSGAVLGAAIGDLLAPLPPAPPPPTETAPPPDDKKKRGKGKG